MDDYQNLIEKTSTGDYRNQRVNSSNTILFSDLYLTKFTDTSAKSFFPYIYIMPYSLHLRRISTVAEFWGEVMRFKGVEYPKDLQKIKIFLL